jgi:hypothetical protein
MIAPWAAWILTAGAIGVLGVVLYLQAWHRGYQAGVIDRLDRISGGPAKWHPPSEVEFLAELKQWETRGPMSNSVKIEIVGEGEVILFSFANRAAVLAVSEREFVGALAKLVKQASGRFPRSALRNIHVPLVQ